MWKKMVEWEIVGMCVQSNTTYNCWYNTLDRRHVLAQNIAIFRPYANVWTAHWSLHCTGWWWHLSHMMFKFVLKSSLKIINCIENTKSTTKPWDVYLYLHCRWVLGDRLSMLGSMVRTLYYLHPVLGSVVVAAGVRCVHIFTVLTILPNTDGYRWDLSKSEDIHLTVL
jgi:hypothetical protein